MLKEKNYYISEYKKYWKELLENEKCFGSEDPESAAMITFADNATTEQIVGFYLATNESPYLEWLKDTNHIKDMNASDREAGRILKQFSRDSIPDAKSIRGENYDIALEIAISKVAKRILESHASKKTDIRWTTYNQEYDGVTYDIYDDCKKVFEEKGYKFYNEGIDEHIYW